MQYTTHIPQPIPHTYILFILDYILLYYYHATYYTLHYTLYYTYLVAALEYVLGHHLSLLHILCNGLG